MLVWVFKHAVASRAVCSVPRSTHTLYAAKNGEDPDTLPLIARLREAESGRVMEVFGSQPSVQVYTANYLSVGELLLLLLLPVFGRPLPIPAD